METWMAGGLGRAQGGYDEMVFRAMVRDNGYFYDPLGLASRAVRVDFQVGVNAYLYGTRFFTYLAYVHSPEKVVAWIRRDEGSERNYADQFQRVFGMPLEQAWQDWIVFEREFQQRNLEELRKNPITPHTQPGRERGWLDIADVLRRTDRQSLRRHSATLAWSTTIGALNIRDGTVRRLADIKRAMLLPRHFAGLRPGQRHAVLHQRQHVLSGPDGGGREDRRGAHAARGRAHRRDRFQPGRPLDLGRASGERTGGAGAHSLPLHRLATGAGAALRVRAVRSRHLARRAIALGVGERSQQRPVPASVGDRQGAGRGHEAAFASSASGSRSRRVSCFPRDGRYLYGSSYYTGVSNIFRYEVATGAIEAVSNAETGFFRPVPLADGRLMVLVLHGRGLRSGDDRTAPAEGRERDHFPGRGSRREAPRGQDLAGSAAEHRRLRKGGRQQGSVPAAAKPRARQRLSGPAGLQGLGRGGHSRQHRGSGSPTSTSASRPPIRRTANCPARSGPTSTSRAATSAGAARCPGTGRISTTCSGRPSAAARATPPSLATTGC